MSSSDLQLLQGQTYNPILSVTKASAIDADPLSATYNPCGFVDVTGFRFRSAWKLNPDPDLAALLEIDSDTPGDFDILTQTALPWTAASTLGQVQANYTAAQTASLAYGRYYVDFWMFDGSDWSPLISPFVIFLRGGVVEPLS